MFFSLLLFAPSQIKIRHSTWSILNSLKKTKNQKTTLAEGHFYLSQNILRSFKLITDGEDSSGHFPDLLGLSVLLPQKAVNICYLLKILNIQMILPINKGR